VYDTAMLDQEVAQGFQVKLALGPCAALQNMRRHVEDRVQSGNARLEQRQRAGQAGIYTKYH
jgi:hypothetical protein